MIEFDQSVTEEDRTFPTTVETVTSSELEELIYKDQSFPQDKRFYPSERGGVFAYFDLEELTRIRDANQKFFSLVKVNDLVVGLAELEKKPGKDQDLWVKFLSIDPQYQEKGYASKLAAEIFRFAQEKGFTLETSSYSLEGFQKLKALFGKLAAEYGVIFTDTEKTI